MQDLFLDLLQLNGMSETTEIVIKGMVAFLCILIFGILIAIINQVNQRKVAEKDINKASIKSKGFQ